MDSVTKIHASIEYAVHNRSSFDYKTLALMAILTVIGFMVQYSAANGSWHPWALRQCIYAGIATSLLVSISYVQDIKRWIPRLYALSIVLLIVVIVAGETKMGATRWIGMGPVNIQPSELAKLAVILIIPLYIANMHLSNCSAATLYMVPIAMVILPVLLVFIQPHLGHSSLILLIGTGIIYVSGFSTRVAATALILTAPCIPAAWIFLLKNYQKSRILSFLHPEKDPLGTGYNVIQSKIAIGSGGLFGKGFLAGPQTHLGFLPEKHTDFVFTIIAEEFGLFGCAVVLTIYALLISRLVKQSLLSEDRFIKLATFGTALMLFLQTTVNTFMALGLMPIVGIPLPLISYGGSSLITSILCIGIVSIKRDQDSQKLLDWAQAPCPK